MSSSWSEQEKSFVKDNWVRLSDTELAEHLGRTANAVGKKRVRELVLLREPHDPSKIFMRKCKTCGKEFEIYLWRVKKGEGNFCSSRCFGAWVKLNNLSHNIVRPNLQPCSELAWFLGAMYSDGSVYIRKGGRYNMELKALDFDYLQKYNECIVKILGRSYHIGETKTPKGKRIFRIRFSNKLLTLFLGERNLEESHRIVIEQFPERFLQAFFDGDGGAYFGEGCGFIQCYGKNRDLLNYISHLLGILGIKSTVSTKESAGTFRCSVRGRNGIEKFYELIGFSIGRKQSRLETMTDLHFMKQLEKEFGGK